LIANEATYYCAVFTMFIAATLVPCREITVGLDEWMRGWDGG